MWRPHSVLMMQTGAYHYGSYLISNHIWLDIACVGTQTACTKKPCVALRAGRNEPAGECCPGGFAMIRSLVATLIAVVFMGSLAVPVQADSTSTGTLTGISTSTPTATLSVFDTSFTGSGTNSVSGAFTSTNMGTIPFTSLTTF